MENSGTRRIRSRLDNIDIGKSLLVIFAPASGNELAVCKNLAIVTIYGLASGKCSLDL
jgi:hypothetical protein